MALPKQENKKDHKGPFVFYWLGVEDSNLYWRSQSPFNMVITESYIL